MRFKYIVVTMIFAQLSLINTWASTTITGEDQRLFKTTVSSALTSNHGSFSYQGGKYLIDAGVLSMPSSKQRLLEVLGDPNSVLTRDEMPSLRLSSSNSSSSSTTTVNGVVTQHTETPPTYTQIPPMLAGAYFYQLSGKGARYRFWPT